MSDSQRDCPTALVLLGGALAESPVPVMRPGVVVAADSGYLHAETLGLKVDYLVGDFDSLPPEKVVEANDRGVQLERHSAHKNETDLEIAFSVVRRLGVEDVTVMGGWFSEGRVDHFLGNILALSHESLAHMQIRACMGTTTITVVRGRTTLRGTPGELVSLLPLGGAVSGLDGSGLLWPLEGLAFQAGSSHGMSNQFTSVEATVSIRSGVLLAVQSGVQGPSVDGVDTSGSPSRTFDAI